MRGRTDGRPRCAVLMSLAKEPCARMVGHKGEHRTRYALDNNYRAIMGRDPSPYCFRGGRWVDR